jgi:hypothetical protein
MERVNLTKIHCKHICKHHNISPFTTIYILIKTLGELVLVAHACDPNYSGDRDQKDHSPKPVWADSS